MLRNGAISLNMGLQNVMAFEHCFHIYMGLHNVHGLA